MKNIDAKNVDRELIFIEIDGDYDDGYTARASWSTPKSQEEMEREINAALEAVKAKEDYTRKQNIEILKKMIKEDPSAIQEALNSI
jgi:hypothetical protein